MLGKSSMFSFSLDLINKRFSKSLFFGDKFVLVNLVLSLILNLLSWTMLYLKFKAVQGHIPLHYNIYFGIDFFGPPTNIFIIPLAGSIILLINFILAYLIFIRVKLLSNFLVSLVSFYEILLLIASLLIINLRI